MSENPTKKKKNDELTKLWLQFRDVVNKRLKLESEIDPSSGISNFEYRLAEAQKWMSGDHFIPKYSLSNNDSDFFNQQQIEHDQVCPIFLAKGFEAKMNTLLKCIEEDPRWVFDPCAINLFFNAADDGNFNFFKNLGGKLSKKNNLKNTVRNDLDNLRWFVFKRVPSYYPYLFTDSDNWKAAVKRQLEYVYQEFESIIEDNIELAKLKQHDSLINKTKFIAVCIKWYTKDDLTKVGAI